MATVQPLFHSAPMGDSLEPKLIDRQVVAVAAIAIVARLVWIALFARTPTGQSDPAFYNEAATRRIDGEGYCSLLGEPTAYYPPGYPAVLSWMNRLSDAIGPEAGPCHCRRDDPELVVGRVRGRCDADGPLGRWRPGGPG